MSNGAMGMADPAVHGEATTSGAPERIVRGRVGPDSCNLLILFEFRRENPKRSKRGSE